MSKLVMFVDGALGRSVVDALARDPSWSISVVFTGTQRYECGVPVIDVDLANVKILEEVVKGARACFIATETNFEDPRGKTTEVAAGRAIGLACKTAGVADVVMVAYLHVERTIGIPVRHYDGKAEVYEYLKFDLQLPVTAVSVPPYYEYITTLLKPVADKDGVYVLDFPDLGAATLDMISLADAAECIRHIIGSRGQFANKTIGLSGNKLTGKEVAKTLCRHLEPKLFKFRQATIQEFRGRQFPGSIDYANMFEFLSRADLKNSIELTRQLNPALKDFSQWVEANRTLLQNVLLG